MPNYAGKLPGAYQARPQVQSHQPAPGKQTLVEHIYAPVVQQRAADEHAANMTWSALTTAHPYRWIWTNELR